jgi:hypothetical protein
MLFWLCTHALQYLYTKTVKGHCFNRPLHEMISDIKTKISRMQDRRLNKSNPKYSSTEEDESIKEKLMAKFPSRINTDVLKTQLPTLDVQDDNDHSAHVTRGGKKYDLQTRLLFAKEEARLESQVMSMKAMEKQIQKKRTRKSRDDAKVGKDNVSEDQRDRGRFVMDSRSREGSEDSLGNCKKKKDAVPIDIFPVLIRSTKAAVGHTIPKDEAGIFEVKDTTKPQVKPSGKAEARRSMVEQSLIGVVSDVWRTAPLEKVQQEDAALTFALMAALNDSDAFKEASKKYADEVGALKRQAQLRNERAKKVQADQQDLEIGKVKAARHAAMLAQKEQVRKNQEEALALKQKFKEEEAQRLHQERMARRQRMAKLEEDKQKERDRIAWLRIQEESKLENEFLLEREREEMEARRFRKFVDKNEVEEVVRRIREEKAMKACEERQRQKMLQKEQTKIDLRKELRDREEQARAEANEAQGRLRRGNFMWHNGVFGFYDDIRKEPVEWIEYDDEEGQPYYYDSITGYTQYKRPTDAPIKHFTDDERDAYDAIHGKGAYKKMMQDKAFKEGVNLNGGYYNDDGIFITVYGHYDEDGEWCPDDGYWEYDEDGNPVKYHRYAKVNGDLSFMV